MSIITQNLPEVKKCPACKDTIYVKTLIIIQFIVLSDLKYLRLSVSLHKINTDKLMNKLVS